MDQKVPIISDVDLSRLIRRDFSQVEYIKVESVLALYIAKAAVGRNRVYASILKLSDGNVELLRRYVELANSDFRDVIAEAEYPNNSKQGFIHQSPNNAAKLNKADWLQYEAWLHKP